MIYGWMLQHAGYGVGNFVMATPALRLLSEKHQTKVKVFFATPPLGELYKDCPFIEVLKKRPKEPPFYSIRLLQRLKKESDAEALCRILKVGKKNIPHTYVDPVDLIDFPKKDKKCVAVFHGCLSQVYRNEKNVGQETRQYIIDRLLEKDVRVVLLGSKGDNDKYWNVNNLKGVENLLGKYSLPESVSILRQCDNFISNDTGLYHVAGAFKKKGLVLWKKTNFIKNKSPYGGIKHCVNPKGDVGLYKNYIDMFLKEI